ncbi:uncharacterized protein K02A2.6-like, partial [Heteronotia binoei]|uniref:uncharacterized protein K02A2.6-like n=1 Tax=Heteronotia binoei TaxID=13085 RepID=UPI002931987F
SLHETHPGIVRMKALARSYVWWPGMDGEIETWVRRCQTCQESRPEPPSAPATRWESTRKPWSRLHIDFAGPFQGQIFMIIVDAYSKWLEVIPVGSTSAAAAIKALRRVLCTHGIPDTIVSDNGTAFTAADFQGFLNRYLIKHIRSAPFHPATNGQAERMVRTTKEGQIFLIIVDAYTKWLEVIPVGSTSSAAAIRALRRVLCTHGIPDTIVSDNGTAFTSGEFQAFLQRYLIRHIRSAPFHPATNGQAERMVRTTKEALG